MTRVSVPQKVNEILQHAVQREATDIHFEPYESLYRVRFRIDGILQEFVNIPLTQKDEFVSRIKILSDLDIAEHRRPQDGKFNFKHLDSTIDVRVSILPTQHGEKVVLRLLQRDNLKWTLNGLGMTDDQLELIQNSIRHPSGMILITGPTGSGKTTTLYSIMNELNNAEINITTIEDPIEYHLPGVNQSHVRSDIDFTFATALRSILRQDPDVIMVGEIRDHETAEIAVRASLTGHLILSTLHTNNAPATISRLVDIGIEPYLVSSSVRLIVAQRLVRLVCQNCKEEFRPDQQFLEKYNIGNQKFYRGAGCECCDNTGYKGRTGIFEIMVIDDEIRNMIDNRATEHEMRQYSYTNGMLSLFSDGLRKATMGLTSTKEVMKQAAE